MPNLLTDTDEVYVESAGLKFAFGAGSLGIRYLLLQQKGPKICKLGGDGSRL